MSASSSTPAALTPIELLDLSAPSRYDLSTYKGRLLHFSSITDIRASFTTQAKLDAALATVEKVSTRAEGWKNVSVDEYYRSKGVVSATLHPDTKVPIPWLFRFCSFIPANVPTLLGMLHPSQQTPLRSMGWQWANQTYNVGVNYFNRTIDVSSYDPKTPFLQTIDRSMLVSYCIAVGTSCSVAFLGNKVLARASAKGGKPNPLLGIAIPFFAVATANIANVAAMRNKDIFEGVKVKDRATGEELPIASRAAGRRAVTEVAISRVTLPIPLLLFPPMIMHYLFESGKVPAMARRRAQLALPVNVATLVGMMFFAVPMAIALFPQDKVMPVSALEPEFAALRNSKGEPIREVIFNKGL